MGVVVAVLSLRHSTFEVVSMEVEEEGYKSMSAIKAG